MNFTDYCQRSGIKAPQPLSPKEAMQKIEAGAIVLDVRRPASFASEHIPKAMYVHLHRQFDEWAKALIPSAKPLILVTESREAVVESTLRLAKLGLKEIEGYLDGGMPEWKRAGLKSESIPSFSAEALAELLSSGKSTCHVIDVRKACEFGKCHIPGTTNFPLDELPKKWESLNTAVPIYLVCASGYRALVAESFLEQKGFSSLHTVTGGLYAWNCAGLPLE